MSMICECHFLTPVCAENQMKVKLLVKIVLIIGLCSSSSFAIKPDRVYSNRPSDFGMVFKEYKVNTPDNMDLNVWEISTSSRIKKETTLILCTGDAGNMGYYLLQAKGFVESGYDVVLFDYRGFGGSSNFAIDTTFLFHNEFLIDFEAVFKDVKIRKKGRVGVLGFSMGGYFPMVSTETPDFIILDSAMLNLNGIVQRLNKPDLKLPANCPKLAAHSVPILAFWGQDDKITWAADNPLRNSRQINICYKGGHMQLFQVLTPFQIVSTVELFAFSF